ncbi:hypothetical protein D187_006442 [Cystobacter fuscus DSM 2262]|uniref:Uncharacterized protein n=1 Tax=Cystobacter fuscus (strain ATCC 25194 / DSM 2262 / NBRC 100088 / M29) TaxID=1242864 RepID=S9PKQ0_CYSF2|nr:hypothetical protein [Cystobacter fuscus]EPX63032.1 hypothetical protein D187_006442 [Cystobacter fuscus DSM 2262]
MENGNRIGTLSITPTVARQTPNNDFGEVMARTARTVANTAGGVVAALAPGAPVVSAAVASVGSVVSTSASSMRGAAALSGTGGAGATTGQGEQWDLLAAQKEMQAEGAKMNLAYMELQNQMQAESRAHNAVSNIMKVRHDSAKAAINNIR